MAGTYERCTRFELHRTLLGVTPLLIADVGDTARAVELWELACRDPAVANSRWWQDVVGEEIVSVAAELPQAIAAAARERGRARDVQATIEELVAEWGE